MVCEKFISAFYTTLQGKKLLVLAQRKNQWPKDSQLL